MAIVLAAFALGRLTATADGSLQVWRSDPAISLIQNSNQAPDPRELIPLPLPGQPDEQDQQMPGQQGQAECPLYFFQDGQFFQLRPGEPGPPGPFGQGNPELFPLDPLPGTPAPAQPAPRQPQPGQPEPPPSEPPPPVFRAPGVAQAPLPAPQLTASWLDQSGAGAPWPAVAHAQLPFEPNASSSR